ncbi:MAG: 4Fe-4S dicluster domain-containing protein [Candidatus Heimdallarchaeota archaeon]|nr:MAG: 4Fe-4S dicluster domain-containing protein [Candidatus Heimdallarchaeota archaeon]
MQVVNFSKRNELINKNLSLSYCYQCSTCAGGCPVALKTAGKYNPRKIIELSLLGLEQSLIESQDINIWLCSTCQKCVEYCPQRVLLTEIFNTIKNHCALAGLAPEAYYLQGKSIFDSGLAIPFSSAILRRREQLGLPLIKTPNIEEIQSLLKKTDFDKKIISKTQKE